MRDFIKLILNFVRLDLCSIKNELIIESIITEHAAIIATGPSVNDIDIDNYYGMDIYTVSNAFLIDEIIKLNPRVHFFTPYHPPLILEEYIKWLRSADEKLPKKTNIVLSKKDKGIIEKFKIFQNRNIIYMVFGNPFNFYNPKYAVATPLTSPQMALMFILNKGYKSIYLIGCDHNILRDFRSVRNHFYEEKSDIRSNTDDWVNIIHHLISELIMFTFYRKLQSIALKLKVSIFNTSKSSWLDIFDYKIYKKDNFRL